MANLHSTIPRRQDLLQKVRNANRHYKTIVTIEVVLCLVLIYFINWRQILNQPLIAVVSIAAIMGPYLYSLAWTFSEKKKEVSQLKETTRFGVFDKHMLQRIYRETLEKLKLPHRGLPLYITADRTLNASSIRNGLGILFKRFNGIFLHRQVLHMLTPEEVQDTIGHELGHYYAYYHKIQDFHFLALILASLIGLITLQWIDVNNTYFGFAIVLVCPMAVSFFHYYSTGNLAHTIEYLCDDFGAHTNGIEVGITALMKLGVASELYTAILFESLSSTKNNNLTAAEILESIERAMPFGHVQNEEVLLAVQRELKRRREQGPSVAGFLKYAWNSDRDAETEEEIEEQLKRYRAMVSQPRLDWEALLDDPAVIQFPGQRLEFLIELIERYPDQPLFYEMQDESNSTHPPLRNRILYLWYNREAIKNSPNPVSEIASQ